MHAFMQDGRPWNLKLSIQAHVLLLMMHCLKVHHHGDLFPWNDQIRGSKCPKLVAS